MSGKANVKAPSLATFTPPQPLPLSVATAAPTASVQPAPAAEPAPASSADQVLGVLRENWKVALAVALISAVAAGGIYWATSAPAPPKEPKKESKKDGKKKKTATAAAKAAPSDKPVPAPEEPSPSVKSTGKPQEDVAPEEDKPKTQAERFEEAKKLKEKGNKYYSGRNYEKAIDLYTEALTLAPESPEAAVFYSNRAACFSSLNQHDKVIEDCTKALAIDKKYVKALNRRAVAFESLNKLEESLVDYTAACILDGFQTQATLVSADKIIKSLGATAAAEYFPHRQIALPANYFLAAYFDSFRNKFETSTNGEPANDGDEYYQQVIEKLDEKDYLAVHDILKNALENNTTYKAQALNLRGTLRYLMGNFDGALEDLNESLELVPKTNTLIKRASVYFEKKESDKSFADFTRAIEIDSEDPDIYYHRGQAHFLIGDLESAMNDYKKSIELDSSVPFVLVQLAVIYFRTGSIQTAVQTFEEALQKFPDYGDLYNYYGEVLTELQRFDDANKNFEKAIQLNPANPLSYINKAFLIARWKEDIPTAVEILNKAIQIDPKCEVAHAHLGQLLIQQNKLDEAIESYKKAVESSRTEAEIAQWFSCIEASKAQKKVLEVYPEIKKAAGLGVAP